MSPAGPVIDPDALRKNVSGIVLGSMPASLTCEAKLVICATTRQGAVTGEISVRLSRGTAAGPDAAASAVRATERVMTRLLSSGRSGDGHRIRCQPGAH